eukprot:1312148-Pyramimonas_sp.AAC.1
MVERPRGRKTPGPDLGGRPTRSPPCQPSPSCAQRGNSPSPTSTPLLIWMRLKMTKLPPWISLICLHT